MTNKELVLFAMNEVFVNRNIEAIDQYWSADYIQHNPYLPNGLDVLKGWVAGLGADFSYEPGLCIEEGEFVLLHCRYTGIAPQPVISADIFKVVDGKFVEHWDIQQPETPAEESASKNAMFPIQ